MPQLLDAAGDPIAPTSDTRRAEMLKRLRAAYRDRLEARYDAAQTTTENERYWAQSDGMSAKAAGSPEVRRKLRERARYEVANDAYCAGMIQTKVIDTLGSVPRLSIQLPNTTAATEISQQFARWAMSIDLGAKLRVMYRAYLIDGESFLRRTIDKRRPENDVQLDYTLHEAEEVATPFPQTEGPDYLDGVYLDDNGRPVAYDLLNVHPGDSLGTRWFGESQLDATRYEAGDIMLHLYRVDRPGQIRGISHLTPALSLFAKRRRYALATVTAAETAASLSAVLYTDHSALTDAEIAVLEDDSFFDLPRGSMPVLPMGYKIGQLSAEHPTETYEMFSRELIQEIARCLGIPLIVALANSQNANYSSGRLDYQAYHQLIQVDRHWIISRVLNHIFEHWLEEAQSIPGYLPVEAYRDNLPRRWFWDPKPHVDPEKEANATLLLWEKGLALDEDHFLENLGRDPAEVYFALEQQNKRRKELGLPHPGQAEAMQREQAEAAAKTSQAQDRAKERRIQSNNG